MIYIYVRAEVNLEMFTNERTIAAISFKHVAVEASNPEEAEQLGYEQLPPLEKGYVANDYVIPAEEEIC